MSNVLQAFENLDAVLDQHGEQIMPRMPEAVGIVAVRGLVEVRMSRYSSLIGQLVTYEIEQAWALGGGKAQKVSTDVFRNRTGRKLSVYRSSPIPPGLSIVGNRGEYFINDVTDGLDAGEGFIAAMDSEKSFVDTILVRPWSGKNAIKNKALLGVVVREALVESGYITRDE